LSQREKLVSIVAISSLRCLGILRVSDPVAPCNTSQHPTLAGYTVLIRTVLGLLVHANSLSFLVGLLGEKALAALSYESFAADPA